MIEKKSASVPAAPSKINPWLHTYLFSFLYNNGTLIIGHPADRLKVAVQVNLCQSQKTILMPFMQGNYRNLYSGFVPSFLRQNMKICYRTLLVSTLPQKIDSYQLHPINTLFLKAILASSADTLITSPTELLKTRFMIATEKKSLVNTVKNIYQHEGIPGFFSGSGVSFAKSFPSWFYLFLGYQATKNKREKQNMLHTIFWATAAATPITLATTPLDLIKSQKQASLRPKHESAATCAKSLYRMHGLPCFWRGFPFRLLHKSLVTAAGYEIMDLSNKLK